MDMMRLRYEVLAMFGCLFNAILSSKPVTIIKRWLRENRKEILKDVFIAVLTALICVVSMNALSHKRVDTESIEVHETIQEAEMIEQPVAPEPLREIVSDPYKHEAEEVARVLYGTARANSEADQRAVVWCIINRCESTLYPNTIEEVCKQPSQWMGYSDKNPIVKDLYNIALEELTTWHDEGYRMVAPEFLFMSWSQNEIVLRTQFNENSTCRYWKSK